MQNESIKLLYRSYFGLLDSARLDGFRHIAYCSPKDDEYRDNIFIETIQFMHRHSSVLDNFNVSLMELMQMDQRTFTIFSEMVVDFATSQSHENDAENKKLNQLLNNTNK